MGKADQATDVNSMGRLVECCLWLIKASGTYYTSRVGRLRPVQAARACLIWIGRELIKEVGTGTHLSRLAKMELGDKLDGL